MDNLLEYPPYTTDAPFNACNGNTLLLACLTPVWNYYNKYGCNGSGLNYILDVVNVDIASDVTSYDTPVRLEVKGALHWT
jgi:hypothetical protein